MFYLRKFRDAYFDETVSSKKCNELIANIRASLQKKQRDFSVMRPCDGQEALGYIIDEFHEYNYNNGEWSLDDPFLSRFSETEKKQWIMYTKRPSFIARNYMNMLCEKISCAHCEYSNVVYSVMIHLPIFTSADIRLLNDNRACDEISYLCEKCHHKSQISKETSFVHTSDMLLLFRITKESPLLKLSIKIPDRFHVYMKYDLVATIHHVGSDHGGHYYAIIRSFGKWFLCDDTNIRKFDEYPIEHMRSIYIYLYKKCD